MRLLCKVGRARVRGDMGVVDVKVQKRRKRGGIRARVTRVVVEGRSKENMVNSSRRAWEVCWKKKWIGVMQLMLSPIN